MGYLKIGRVCLTCTYRCGTKTKNGEFMECAARKEIGLPAVWTMARCAVWELCRDPKRLKQYEKHTELKVCGKPDVFREYFYSRFNNMGWWEYNPPDDWPSVFLLCPPGCQVLARWLNATAVKGPPCRGGLCVVGSNRCWMRRSGFPKWPSISGKVAKSWVPIGGGPHLSRAEVGRTCQNLSISITS